MSKDVLLENMTGADGNRILLLDSKDKSRQSCLFEISRCLFSNVVRLFEQVEAWLVDSGAEGSASSELGVSLMVSYRAVKTLTCTALLRVRLRTLLCVSRQVPEQ